MRSAWAIPGAGRVFRASGSHGADPGPAASAGRDAQPEK